MKSASSRHLFGDKFLFEPVGRELDTSTGSVPQQLPKRSPNTNFGPGASGKSGDVSLLFPTWELPRNDFESGWTPTRSSGSASLRTRSLDPELLEVNAERGRVKQRTFDSATKLPGKIAIMIDTGAAGDVAGATVKTVGRKVTCAQLPTQILHGGAGGKTEPSTRKATAPCANSPSYIISVLVGNIGCSIVIPKNCSRSITSTENSAGSTILLKC